MLRSASVALVLILCGCVAPERPDPPVAARPVQPPAPSTATYENAPTPNHRVTRPASDDIVRLAH